MPIRESTVFDRRRVNVDAGLLAAREARLLQYAAQVSKHEMPAHGIEPRRGINRPVVILTLATVKGAQAGCLVEPSVTSAAAMLGIETCSVCEGIRDKRPVKGHVIRYVDQLADVGQVVDGLWIAHHEPELSFRELVRLRNADADAPAGVPSN